VIQCASVTVDHDGYHASFKTLFGPSVRDYESARDLYIAFAGMNDSGNVEWVQDRWVSEIYESYHGSETRQRADVRSTMRCETPKSRRLRHARYEFLLRAVQMYALDCAARKRDKEWTPYPATWFNRKSYLNNVQRAGITVAICQARNCTETAVGTCNCSVTSTGTCCQSPSSAG